MRIIFLGTNGWYDTDTGNTVSIAVDLTSCVLVLDAGSGIAKLDRYVELDRPVYLFLSHLHLDHITGLHTISANAFRQGLFICAEAYNRRALEMFLDHPFTVPIRDFPFATRFVNLPEEAGSLPFAVKALPLVHAVPTMGYRFEAEGKVLAYVGDTGYCANAVELAQDADLLITECAYRVGEENAGWPHLNPGTAARIASEGRAKGLALVHFDARLYRTWEDRLEAEAYARNIFAGTFAARDGMVIEV